MVSKLTPTQRLLILEAKKRGLIKTKAPVYRHGDFIRQNNYLDARAKARHRAALCTRRAGKSMGEAIDHLEIGSLYPNSRQVYGGLTVSTVFDIIWDIFLELDEEYKIGIKTIKNEYKIILPNKTQIQLFGLDASHKQMRKILGRKLRKATIDEAGSITTGLEKIVKQAINPALADLRPYSWLSLIGTPENIPNTYFEKVTTGHDKEIGWSLHSWTAYENPYMEKQWTEEVAEMKENNPLVVNASWFKTHYLGQWCTDEEMLIISFNEERDYVSEWIKNRDWDWYYILGVDIGYNDATAFVVLVTSPYSHSSYIIEAFKQEEMDFTDVANTIKAICQRYPIDHRVIDGANKQGVQEIINRHGIQLEPAEKQDKNIHLRLLSDDLKMNKLKLVKDKTTELANEWKALVWKDEMKEKEDDRCQNHLSDAALYAWRKSLHFLGLKQAPKLKYDSEERLLQWEKQEEQRLMQEKEDMGYLW